MSDRFIKFIPSDEADFLQENHPNAFLLLCLIAKRARRISGKPDGLIIGDAIIGDHKKAGLTRQQYRTALDKLEEFAYIEIVHNGKKFLKREKSTIKVTITGTLVNIKDSRIWDINSNDTNHSINQRATNEQPTTNHEQERTIQKEEEQQPQTPSLNSDPVVVFPCLSKISDPSISENEKLKITKKHLHEEQVVIDAVAAITSEKFEPDGTLLKALRAAIKHKWKPNANDFSKNKALALNLEKITSQCKFTALNAYLEIDRGGQSIPPCIIYSMPFEKFCAEIEKQAKIKIDEILQRIG
jgi:hypothetical protein